MDRLLNIKSIPNGLQGELVEVTPYEAVNSNQSREDIYLRTSLQEEAVNTLSSHLRCNTKVVGARPIGRAGKTILVTFEGKTPPRRVKYDNKTFSVNKYNPRPLVCYTCHQLEHEADVCPNESARKCDFCCKDAHDGNIECDETPACANCNGTHTAKSTACPLRAIPKFKNPVKNQDGRHQPNPLQKGRQPLHVAVSKRIIPSVVATAQAPKVTTWVKPPSIVTEPHSLKERLQNIEHRFTRLEKKSQLAHNYP